MSDSLSIKLSEAPMRMPQPWMFEERAHYSTAAPDQLSRDFKLRVGDRPVVRDMRKLYTLSGQTLPPVLQVLPGDLYLITHAVGMDTASNNKVRLLGYRASFAEYGATIDLLPNTLHREYFKANLGFEAGITADGHGQVPDQVTNLLNTIDLGLNAKLQLSAQAGVLGKLSLSLQTTKIAATGQSSSVMCWQFHKDDSNLVEQVMVQTLLVPKGQETVTFKLQAFADVKVGWFSSTRLETEEKVVQVKLLV
jgi:hypothetical protein